MINQNTGEKFIHIKADSDIYCVNELVAEKKSLKRLRQIRENFVKLNLRHGNVAELSVKTCINNPTMF
jgi:hypothetical protein